MRFESGREDAISFRNAISLRDAKFAKNYSPKRKDYVQERITRIVSTTITYIQFVLL